MPNTYNGWKNRETWNVSLWINNTEGLYRAAVEFMKTDDAKINPYRGFIKANGLSNTATGDGVPYLSGRLDYNELNQMMRELI